MVSCELGISHYTHFPVCNGGVLLSRFTVSSYVIVLFMLFDIVNSLCWLFLYLLYSVTKIFDVYLLCECIPHHERKFIVITYHFEGETM